MIRFFNVCLWVTGACVFCFVWGFAVEPTQLKTKQVTVDVPGWQGDPVKIGFMADIHIGGEHVPSERVAHIVEKLMSQNLDIILIAGDFIDGHRPRTAETAAFNIQIDVGMDWLKDLDAPLGVHSVIGNHDVWYDVDYVRTKLNAIGINVLENETLEIDHRFCLLGMEDDITQKPSARSLDSCTNDNIIALMHSPDSFGILPSHVDLALAGHTHGGQINLPIFGRAVTPTQTGRKTAYGLIDYNGLTAFVTAGIGTSIIPARFRAPPEIVIIQLQSARP